MALTANTHAIPHIPEAFDTSVLDLTDQYGEFMTLEQVADVLYLSINTVQKRIGAEKHQHLPWVSGVKSARVWPRCNKLFHTHLIAPVMETI